MPIYHLHAKIISRAEGRSVVGAAAYRAASKFLDARTGYLYDYSDKPGVEHTEILAPQGAGSWVFDRLQLWNRVEAIERRRDAQLARELEIALPVELSKDQQIALMRDFLQRHFVEQGMVADFAIHRDNPENPHAHVLLTMRTLEAEAFGLKRRDWNAKAQLRAWRSQWAEVANEHLARAGLDLTIDHRTLEAQHIDLVPGRKIGLSLARQEEVDLPRNLAERVAESRAIARENGERILAEPALALQALTHTQATFSRRDLARFLHTRTDGAQQFEAALLKVMTSPEVIVVGRDDAGRERYTSREMLALEESLLSHAEVLTLRAAHRVSPAHERAAAAKHPLATEQQAAFEQLLAEGDLKALIGVAGSGKSRLLAAAFEAWAAEAYTVQGAALSGIAAENLAYASGIPSRTLASLEHAWALDRDALTSRHVLVIDEAGMLGTRQLARVLEEVTRAHAKVVLIGDPEQLQAIEAGAAFRGILAESGAAQLREVHRQRAAWQREATREFSVGDTAAALERYAQHASLIAFGTREAARAALLAQWHADGSGTTRTGLVATPPAASASPSAAGQGGAQRLILAYTREEVAELNVRARAIRRAHGELGREESIDTARGPRVFAAHDHLYFLRNERSLGVKNGSLGTIQTIEDGVLQVRLDAPAGTEARTIRVDTRFYRDLDHGYAATVYKAQGATVDRSYILATAHFDRHSTYVALSRHRESAQVFYAGEDFGAAPAVPAALARARLFRTLSRARPKELAHDYLDPSLDALPPVRWQPGSDIPLTFSLEERRAFGARAMAQEAAKRLTMDELEALQQQAAARWLAKQRAREAGLDPGAGAGTGDAHRLGIGLDRDATHTPAPDHAPHPGHGRGGADEDLDL